jgi:exodeoxyribonuclease VII large subunit
MTAPKIFTVSEIVRDVRVSLETMYPDVWVGGEISNLNRHSSGHCYLSLKDAAAQLSVVIFRDDFRRLVFLPENGMQVTVHGRLTVYPAQGKFQMVAVAMEPQGRGALQIAFEQLKTKLEKEGLFRTERKRPLPALPQWIGVVTSLDGAALHDILSVLNRRFAGLRILVAPVKVQGAGAAEEIAQAIERLNREFPDLEVLLIGRGGGSLEDLWAFNEETVARAIAGSRIPVISCVGHETDFTIADFVADLRAPTPSAAAEIVIRSRLEILELMRNLTSRLCSYINYRFGDLENRLRHAAASRMLTHPGLWIDERFQDVDRLTERLRQVFDSARAHQEKDLRHLCEKLQLLSPLATLSRGYAVAWKLPERRILKDAGDTAAGQDLEVQVAKGRVYAKVQRTEL